MKKTEKKNKDAKKHVELVVTELEKTVIDGAQPPTSCHRFYCV